MRPVPVWNANPGNIRAQLFAGDGAIGEALQGRTVLRRCDRATTHPVVYYLWRNAEARRDGGLGADYFNDFFKGTHKRHCQHMLS